MNKRECVNYCYEQQAKAWNKPINKTFENHENMQNAYLHCKQVCADNGYVGDCFVQLWNKATNRRARENGIYFAGRTEYV